jgi:hypothetical protein
MRRLDMLVTVGFSHANNLFSKLIMWLTNSAISHCYVRLPNDIVFQASGLTVNEQAYEYFITYETVLREVQVELTDEQFAAAEKFRLESLGKPYSMAELIGFIPILLLRKVGIKLKNPLSDGSKAYVCVKLVAQYIGVNDKAENMYPQDLSDFIDLHFLKKPYKAP